MSNYNSYPQQSSQDYPGYPNYPNYNSHNTQYPNYDYYYQQQSNQQQYYQPTNSYTGQPEANPQAAYSGQLTAYPMSQNSYNGQPVANQANHTAYNGQPVAYQVHQPAYTGQPTSYPGNQGAHAGHVQPQSYDQSNSAHWNYYAQYYPQHYQRPPKAPAPIADTRPMNKFCCNRALKTVQAITQHELLHIQCPHCDFRCLKSYLEEHEEQYHGKLGNKKPSRPDGIAPSNAPKLDTPEKLAAWIAERKRNWPTPENVERRAREEAEQMARGELPLKRKANVQHNERQNKRQTINNAQPSSTVENKEDDDDDIMDPERDAVTSKNPLSSGKILLPEDRPKRKCVYFMRGRCNKGSKCNFLHEKPTRPSVTPVVKKRNNLLFKLLEKEIKQEKSVILQCFRYIVDNNFFGKEPNSKMEENITKGNVFQESVAQENVAQESVAQENVAQEDSLQEDTNM